MIGLTDTGGEIDRRKNHKMLYITQFVNGQRVQETYLVRKINVGKTKAGKDYWNVVLSDSTGTIDGKIWNPSEPSIGNFDELDYVAVSGDIQEYKGELQMVIHSASKVDSSTVDQADYMPSTKKNITRMFTEVLEIMNSVTTPYFKELLLSFYDDPELATEFQKHSAAKTVHHSFVGGLLEHTLSVTKLCDFFAQHYPNLNRDLLVTAALLHDAGKIYELNDFPANVYTDAGQLLGHIYIGAHLVENRCDTIEGFPEVRKNELIHCILAHHGELEFGSPKKPSLAEAIALSFADNLDAKMETFHEAAASNRADGLDYHWIGFNKFLDANIRKTSPEGFEGTIKT